MATLRDNKGIALVTALLFTLISLGIIMALLTIVIQGTRVSAANKSYNSAIEASYGAIDVVSRDIMPAILKGTFGESPYTYKSNMVSAISLAFMSPADYPASQGCFGQKIGSSTALWDPAVCTGQPTSPVATQSYDMTFNLKATNDPVGFKVYTKITDTRCGGDTAVGQPCTNSDGSGIDYLDAGGGVTSSAGTVTPQHRPAYYRIEVQGERAVNPKEKSQLSVLYAY